MISTLWKLSGSLGEESLKCEMLKITLSRLKVFDPVLVVFY